MVISKYSILLNDFGDLVDRKVYWIFLVFFFVFDVGRVIELFFEGLLFNCRVWYNVFLIGLLGVYLYGIESDICLYVLNCCLS